MIVYPETSTKTIRQRLEQIIANRPAVAKDIWINIYDNSTEYSPENFGFYISDYNNLLDSIEDNEILDYRLDTMTKSANKLNLGFNHFRNNKDTK
jgi:hypothetical protein